jgi:hypothetical protein
MSVLFAFAMIFYSFGFWFKSAPTLQNILERESGFNPLAVHENLHREMPTRTPTNKPKKNMP